jgi:hypothetical protein
MLISQKKSVGPALVQHGKKPRSTALEPLPEPMKRGLSLRGDKDKLVQVTMNG